MPLDTYLSSAALYVRIANAKASEIEEKVLMTPMLEERL